MSRILDAGWVLAASVTDLAEGQAIGRIVAGKPLAIYRLAGNQFHATSNMCTHGYARLSEGLIEDGAIECPLHAGRFDIRTGRALCGPLTRDLEILPVRVVGDEIHVRLAPEGPIS